MKPVIFAFCVLCNIIYEYKSIEMDYFWTLEQLDVVEKTPVVEITIGRGG